MVVKMNERLRNTIENLITLAIILVLIQTMAEDIFVLLGADWDIRMLFIYTGLAFDLLFTLEFLIRSWAALSQGGLGKYLWQENGWVDFVASVPILVFNSGPALLTHISGTVFIGSGSLIGLLKIVKAVRMARVLRILRLLKIVRRIRFADSKMVQRHTVRIITTAVATLIFSASISGAVFAFIDSLSTEEVWHHEQIAAVESLVEDASLVSTPDAAKRWGRSRPSVILLRSGDWTLYSKYHDEFLMAKFGPSDYSVLESDSYAIWFDSRPLSVAHSRLNLILFVSNLVVVLMLMITYSPHFAITVSDPVNVMLCGITQRSYNLEVRIPRQYAQDDIFRLAKAFNDTYLPLKERSDLDEQGGTLDISLDDINDLLES